ncbi:N-acetylmuramoyl-L-alanine amidase [Lactobacillus sp. S2-2]|nr:N-acetylmuramoyl-L-alanine amidase [Lactobacillus sp. S2-2]
MHNNILVKSNSLLINQKPDISSKVENKVNIGTRLQIIGSKNHWYRVVYHKNKIGWVPKWSSNRIIAPKNNKLAQSTIVLDPGHGGSDSGALSSNNDYEKKYTLIFAEKTKKKLERLGANVILTRNKDEFVSLQRRPQIASDNKATIFVSFHFDSSNSKNSASGFTSYFYHPNRSYKLAKSINNNLNNLPLKNRGTDFGNYLVIRDTVTPSVLLEMGYINNDKDFSKIKNLSYQNTVSNDVCNGIRTYIDKEYK